VPALPDAGRTTAGRTRPRGAADLSCASASAASLSARMRAARTASTRPVSVSAKRREVRWIRRSPMRASSRCNALDTVAREMSSSPAAPAKGPVSATLAKIAQLWRSGRGMFIPKNGKRVFPFFLCLEPGSRAICLPSRRQTDWAGYSGDDHVQARKFRARRLALRQASDARRHSASRQRPHRGARLTVKVRAATSSVACRDPEFAQFYHA
jgi:hypothetical protein